MLSRMETNHKAQSRTLIIVTIVIKQHIVRQHIVVFSRLGSDSLSMENSKTILQNEAMNCGHPMFLG